MKGIGAIERWLQRQDDTLLYQADGGSAHLPTPPSGPVSVPGWRGWHEAGCPCLDAPVPCTCSDVVVDPSLD